MPDTEILDHAVVLDVNTSAVFLDIDSITRHKLFKRDGIQVVKQMPGLTLPLDCLCQRWERKIMLVAGTEIFGVKGVFAEKIPIAEFSQAKFVTIVGIRIQR